MRTTWMAFIVAVLAAMVWMTGCGGESSAGTSGKPVVVCTIFAYYDAARAIAGDKADVKILLPPGQSPHDMQATPSDRAAVYKARLYVKNGLGLDDRFDGLLDGSKAKVLDIGKIIDTKMILKTEEVALDPGAKKEEEDAFGNPHIWLDPHIQMAAAEKIRDALVESDPADAAAFKANAAVYLESLKKVDGDFAEAAAHFKTKEFIGFHSAYDYLAHRYGLKQIASIEEVPGTGLTIAQTEKIVKLIQDKKIKYVAVETAFSAQGIERIKERTGIQTIVLQPLETYDNMSDTYVKLMRENLEALKKALGT